MQPSGDSGDSSSEEEESSGQDDDSTVAEELAYLRQVQKSTPAMSRSTDLQQHRVISQQQQQQQQKMRHWHDRSSSRASSQSGHMSMMTAPSELRRLSQTSQNSISNIRSLSAASGRSTMGLGIGTPISRRNMNRRKELYDDHFDDSVNPWSLHPSTHQYKVDEPPLANRQSSQQDMSALYRSPVSTSSSATATQQYTNEHRLGRADSQTAEQTVLGPATKRALEALQREIEVLNERINELRKELVDRDQSKRIVTVKKAPSATTTAADDEGWKWVFKVIIPLFFSKHIEFVFYGGNKINLGCSETCPNESDDRFCTSTRFIQKRKPRSLCYSWSNSKVFAKVQSSSLVRLIQTNKQ